MPIVGGCSAVTSAACCQQWRRPTSDVGVRNGIEHLPVRWGVVEAYETHFYCGFSNEETTLPDCSVKFVCWSRKVKGVMEGLCCI